MVSASEAPTLVAARALERLNGTSQRGGTAAAFPVRFNDTLWVCKQYNPAERAVLDVPVLQELIAWRAGLTAEEQGFLDANAAWPRSLVIDDKGPSGVLLPLGQQFLEQPVRRGFKPRHLTRLTRPFEEGRIYYEMPQKLARLALLGELMNFLHYRDVVIGDVQPNNALTTAPEAPPAILLLDCDSVLLRKASVLPQLDPGHYKLPVDRPFDRSSDFYKFATLVVRCVQEDNTAVDFDDVRAGQVMRTADVELIRRALAEDPHLGDPAMWTSLLRNWRGSVTREGELFVRNDRFVKQEWRGLVASGNPGKDAAQVVEVPARRIPDEDPALHDLRLWAALVLVLLIVLVVVAVAAA